VQHGCGG